MPVESFEISLVDIGIANWQTAPAVARLLIGFEFVIGFLFLFLFRLRKVTIPIAAVLLNIFTVYLLLLINAYGNKGNCGCFGELITLTPLQGILKNILLLLLMGFTYRWASDFEFRFKWLPAVIGVVAFIILPFILNPMGFPFTKKSIDEYKPFHLNVNLVSQSTMDTALLHDLMKGKHIVSFLSSVCPHCRIAAKKLAVIHKKNASLPIIFVLYNNKEKMQQFFDDTKSENIPHLLMENKEDFLTVVKNIFPRIYFVNNGTVEYETNYFELEQKDIEQWLLRK